MTNTYAVLLKMLLDLPPDRRTLMSAKFHAQWRLRGQDRPPNAPCGCLLGTVSDVPERPFLNQDTARERFALDVDFQQWVKSRGLPVSEVRAAELANDSYKLAKNPPGVCEERYANTLGALAGMAFRVNEALADNLPRPDFEDYLLNHFPSTRLRGDAP